MELLIRDFEISDANLVFKIIKDCFENLKIGGHNSEGMKMQIAGNSPEILIERAKTVHYITALINNKVVGIGGYDNEKIHTLFVSRKCQRSGIGEKLLDEIIKRAKQENIESLITWSTFYARNFYEKNGFKMVKEVSFPENKKDIILLEMRKELI